MDNPGWLLG